MEPTAIFKQPNKWNYLVDDSIPLTWKYRWRHLKVVVPLQAVSSVLLVEVVLGRAWLEDRLNGRIWITVLLSPLFLGLCLLMILELSLWIQHRTARKLTLTKRALQFSHGKSPVRWSNVVVCRFEPVAGEPELTRFSLAFRLDRKGRLPRTWAMIFASQQEANRLRVELAARKETGATFDLVESDEIQTPVELSGPKMKSAWLMSVAFFLFVHGFGMFGASVTPPSGQNAVKQEQTSESKKQARQFVRTHFKSAASFRAFLGITGGALTGLAALLYLLALRTQSQRSLVRVEISPGVAIR